MTYNMPHTSTPFYSRRPRCETCGKWCFRTTNDARAFVAYKRRADPRGSTRVYWYRCGQVIHLTGANQNHLGEINPELTVRLW